MARLNLGDLSAWRPDSFPAALTAYVFGRAGGVSAAPWRGLNVGGSVGDDPAAVAENRRRVFAAVGRDPAGLFDAYQVHGVTARVARGDTPAAAGAIPPPGDILLTDRPERTLFMRFADCTPILLYDPTRRAVALAHAGWKGTVADVAGEAVRALGREYGSQPGDLLAAIGPSIGVHHYPVGAEVAAAARAAFGAAADERLLRPAGEQVQFDLWAANTLALERAGVRQIEVAGLCTACEPEVWFSHRAEAGRTGRFGAVLGLPAA